MKFGIIYFTLLCTVFSLGCDKDDPCSQANWIGEYALVGENVCLGDVNFSWHTERTIESVGLDSIKFSNSDKVYPLRGCESNNGTHVLMLEGDLLTMEIVFLSDECKATYKKK